MRTRRSLLTIASRMIPRQEASLLLCFVLGIDKVELIMHQDEAVEAKAAARFLIAVAKRFRHVPIAYLLGEKEFYGRTFFVNKHTLVPRPETEHIIEDILAKHPTNETLLDIGTGSGIIAITMKRECPTLEVVATDISKKAITVARKNAKEHHVSVSFFHADLLASNDIEAIVETAPMLIVTANLPYVPKELWREEKSIKREPKRALVAKDGGLALYKRLLAELSSVRKQKMRVYMEIIPDQAEALTAAIHEHFTCKVEKIFDLSGKVRVLVWEV